MCFTASQTTSVLSIVYFFNVKILLFTFEHHNRKCAQNWHKFCQFEHNFPANFYCNSPVNFAQIFFFHAIFWRGGEGGLEDAASHNGYTERSRHLSAHTRGMMTYWQLKPIAGAIGFVRTSLTTARSILQPIPTLAHITMNDTRARKR